MSDYDDLDDGYDDWHEDLAEERYQQGISDYLDDRERNE